MTPRDARQGNLVARAFRQGRFLIGRAQSTRTTDLALSMGLVMGLGFVQNLVLARFLGPEGLGQVSVVNSTLGFGALIAAAGMSTAILRHSAARKDEGEAWGIYRRGARYAAMGSLLIGLLLAALAWSPLWIFDPVAGYWMPVLAIALLPLTSSACAVKYLHSRSRIRDRAVLEFGTRLIQVVTVVVGVVADGFRGFAFGYIIGAALGWLLTFARTWQVRPRHPKRSPVSAREFLSFGSWSLLSQILWYALHSIDLLFISALLEDPAATGFYGLAVLLQRTVRLPLMAYLDATFPRLARQSGDLVATKRSRLLTRRRLVSVSLITIAAAGGIAPLAVPLVFGAAYRASIPSLLILLVGQFAWSLGAAAGRSMLATGDVRSNFFAGLLAMLVNIVGNPVLITRFGIEGAAIATVASQLTWSLAVTMICRRTERKRRAESRQMETGSFVPQDSEDEP
ncbi:MAG: oligosaccharide flippase family protein [Myxococcota bacterium]|nr:oligosaccharide flippase family protein [Myxococcota bacterium]